MAARDPGAPSIAETTRMRANAQTGATSTSRRYQWQVPLNDKKATNEFPIVPTPHDPYDDIANIKQQFAVTKALKDHDTNWVVPFTDADAEFERRKRDAQEKAQFDAWVMQKYDISDPAQNLMLQNIAPELFQRREEVIDSQQALVSAYAKTRLRGAKSLSDLELEWLIETGRLELPKGPIWNPLDWRTKQAGINPADNEADQLAADAKWNATRYRYGMFSPMKWLTTDTAGWEPSANAADIRGNPTKKYTNLHVPYPNPTWANSWSSPVPYPYAGSNTHTAVDSGSAYAALAPIGEGDAAGTPA
jgi:hypothetical protein